MNVLKSLFTSRKFLAALAGVIAPVLNAVFQWNISEDSLLAGLGLLALFIAGTAAEDFATKLRSGQPGGSAPAPNQLNEAIGGPAASPTPAPESPK